jgi:hypothetical protein
MSASNKTWTWSVVRTPGIYADLPDFYDPAPAPRKASCS